MKIVVVYDSVYGNTRTIAETVRDMLATGNEVRLASVQEARNLDLTATELLVVGSPTRGFRPTPHISSYVEGLDRVAPGKLAAAFDTRLDLETVKPEPLRWVIDVGGYAASRIAASLERHGFVMKGGLAGFLVEGAEGPLKDGEVERAREWARNLLR
ncbi:MAG TPA: flavodoxin domain-containing protein [Devosia sp.]|jgi:flavodoxin|nr:flavodoxin domain-containing protein [Devosia sp.]